MIILTIQTALYVILAILGFLIVFLPLEKKYDKLRLSALIGVTLISALMITVSILQATYGINIINDTFRRIK